MTSEALAETSTRRYGIYRLSETDRPEFLRHLLALDRDGRRWRFGVAVSDGIIENLAKTLPLEPLSVGLIIWGELKGCAQVIRQGTSADAELAVSLGSDMRGRGWGAILVDQALALAQAKRVRRVDIQYLSGNTAMHRIARSYPGTSSSDCGEISRQVQLDLCDF